MLMMLALRCMESSPITGSNCYAAVRVSWKRFPNDVDDARPVRGIRPITGSTQLSVQRSGHGGVSLTTFPADADDARPARSICPMTGSSCLPAAGFRKSESEIEHVSS